MQCVPHGPSGQTVYILNKQQNSWVGINVALRPGKGWQLHLKKKLLCEFLKLTWPSCWCCEDTLLSPKNKLRGGKRPSEGFLRCYLATLSPRACVLSLALSPQDKIETVTSGQNPLRPNVKSYKSFREPWGERSLKWPSTSCSKALSVTLRAYGEGSGQINLRIWLPSFFFLMLMDLIREHDRPRRWWRWCQPIILYCTPALPAAGAAIQQHTSLGSLDWKSASFHYFI